MYRYENTVRSGDGLLPLCESSVAQSHHAKPFISLRRRHTYEYEEEEEGGANGGKRRRERGEIFLQRKGECAFFVALFITQIRAEADTISLPLSKTRRKKRKSRCCRDAARIRSRA